MKTPEYTELEKMANDWLDETDTMQFSQMELLTMFAAHCAKSIQLSDEEIENMFPITYADKGRGEVVSITKNIHCRNAVKDYRTQILNKL